MELAGLGGSFWARRPFGATGSGSPGPSRPETNSSGHTVPEGGKRPAEPTLPVARTDGASRQLEAPPCRNCNRIVGATKKSTDAID